MAKYIAVRTSGKGGWPMLRFALVLPLFAGAAFSQSLDDRQVSVIPRTAAEEARIAKVLAPPSDFSKPEPFEAKPGGAATVRATGTTDVFSNPSANISFLRESDFKLGDGLFRKTWVPAPTSTKASDGLGPLYNARACQDCHLKDGRGHTPEGPKDEAVSMFLRLSVPGTLETAGIEGYLATLPDPTYGGQLQELASPGHAAEGRMEIAYADVPVKLADGSVVTLRKPEYSVSNLGYGPMAEDVMLSPRVAPQMIGLGLLEAIPAADILAGQDPDDATGDGISGRVAIVVSAEFGVPMLGRFGYKGGAATIRDQSAGAFSGDMGLSTPLHSEPSGDCTSSQANCLNALAGQEPGIRGGLEVDGPSLDLVTFYARNLGVPERRNVADPVVLRGKEVFYATGCQSCHTPKFVTNRLKGQPEQSFQLIWPYTDLLLHDMGEGLADQRPEGRASGTEWKTPPLWGIGLNAQIAGRTEFLHDGRARTLMEAILWHGGEAQAQRDAVVGLSQADRDAMTAFLESL